MIPPTKKISVIGMALSSRWHRYVVSVWSGLTWIKATHFFDARRSHVFIQPREFHSRHAGRRDADLSGTRRRNDSRARVFGAPLALARGHLEEVRRCN